MAGKSILENQYSFKSERAAEAIGVRLSGILTYPLWDLENQREEVLDFIAETVQAIGFWAGYPVDGKRSIIRNALRLHQLKGTVAGLKLFGQLGGFSIRWISNNYDVANSEFTIDFFVSPSVFSENTPDWQEYIKRTLTKLLPVGRRLRNFTIESVFEGHLYYSKSAQAIDVKIGLGYG